MALASQMARGQRIPSSSVAAFRAKRRTRARVALGVTLLVVLGGGGLLWALWSRDSGGSLAGPQEAAASSANPITPTRANDPLDVAAVAPTPPSAPPAEVIRKPEPQPPTTFTMGASPVAPPPVVAALPPAPLPLANTPPATTPATVRDPLVGNPAVPSQPAPALATTSLPGDLGAAVESAEKAQRDGKNPEARTLLNRVLLDRRTPESERPALRRWMSELSDVLAFSPTIAQGDPYAAAYTVVGGDSLPVINRKLGLTTEYMLIARINKLTDPSRIQVGQKLKTLSGPFHAVVSKSAFRMDVYAGDPPSPGSVGMSTLACGAEPGWVYIRSFMVGLGADDGTPVANFVVKNGSKLVNPLWRNPRTGQKFEADDPKNPIGERWIGLEGLDDASKAHTGFGVHGTVEPESIGRSLSMGCIRLGAQDVELVYELLAPKVSVVKIVP